MAQEWRAAPFINTIGLLYVKYLFIICALFLCFLHVFFRFVSVGAASPAERPKSTEPTSSDPNHLRRACSLSDLNRPNVTRRILPAPPTNGIVIYLFSLVFLLHSIIFVLNYLFL